ncbi:proteasome regulatory particle base subunit [Nowakowskiella sp. JEL0407]|nr:proteasome regulatory particle base subunit [Nowakowskiella sp. JEL0407]
MVSSVSLTSAAGLLSLLDEPEDLLKIYALEKLDSIVDVFWAEIADYVSRIEELYEDESFKSRQLAALVASKIYYHLGEFDDSVQFALGAGDLFDINGKSEYVETIIAKCIDKYIELRSSSSEKIDSRLEIIVEKMFTRCFADNEYEQAIGIALESFRLDVIENAIKKSSDFKGPAGQLDLLNYVLSNAMTVVVQVEFRNKVLRLLVQMFREMKDPDWIAMAQCLVDLNDWKECSQVLKTLVEMKEEKMELMAYQIAFDLEENATQEFLSKLKSELPGDEREAVPMETDAMVTDEAAQPLLPANDASKPIFQKIQKILKGEISIRLNLEFLFKNNRADLLILKNIKNALESRNSIYHSAVSFANAYMHSGTTSDEFLRQNLEWLSRATNWTKFTATAALGVIHKGHIEQGMKLLKPYLPAEGVSGSAYSEGGALFALGLIHTNHGAPVVKYLLDALKGTQNEVIQHGACLGLGVAAMATDNMDVYEDLKNILYSDSAVAGEAAGLAMGLVMLGTNNTKVLDDMLLYAHDTQHEKIIRGLAVGMAMIMYGKEEGADGLIDQLCSDKDPILRYGGIYTIAMAYAGTGNNRVLKKLLHVAVSDVNDDVRRASVTAIGFLLCRNATQVPKIVQLLSESYNPHVRYGASLALGISCAGTGMKEALDLLEPMLKDSVDFVRQGALLAKGMVLVQMNETLNPEVGATRKMYEKIVSDKHEDSMTKFGAILGQGIIDAGGRNVTISLQSRSGYLNMSSIVGMALFTQYWYWYPMAHLLSLSFAPTAIIGLNKNLEMPKMTLQSNAKPSLFAYQPAIKPPTVEAVEKVATAVLSTTAKAKARAKRNEKKEDGSKSPTKEEVMSPTVEAMDLDEPATPVVADKKKKKEPSFEVLENLSRVVPIQRQYISFKEDARFVPVRKTVTGGITIMIDRKPDEPVEIIPFSSQSTTTAAQAPPATATTPSSANTATVPTSGAGNEGDAPPPAAFEYRED